MIPQATEIPHKSAARYGGFPSRLIAHVGRSESCAFKRNSHYDDKCHMITPTCALRIESGKPFPTVKSEVFCRLPFLRVVGSCSCWLRGQLAEGVARSELAPQAAPGGGSVTAGGSSSMRR